MRIDGLIAHQSGKPARVESLELTTPGVGEVLVRLQASGVCHSDLHYRNGALGEDFPYLLGHEGAGVVERCGPGVTACQEGDYVALSYRAPCRHCRFCRSGRIDHCVTPVAAAAAPALDDGSSLTRALDLGTHATHTVVAESQAVPIDPRCPPEVACLLGCGVSTGIGAVLNTAQVPAGATVAVVGCGGVGANVLQGARIARASRVIGIDISESKIAQARTFGATDVVDARGSDVVSRIRDLTDGCGVDYAFDAVGSPSSLRQCSEMLDYRGTAVLIGLPSETAELTLPMLPFFFAGATVKVSLGGDIIPSRDLPLLVQAYVSGGLGLDGLVSRTIALDEVEDAFTAMLDGDVLRSVVTFG